MPNNFPEKPESFEKPVSWLAGRDLIAGLRKMILAAFSTSDPRIWMSPNVYPSKEQVKDFLNTKGFELHDEHLQESALQDPLVDEFWREKNKQYWEAKAKIYADWTAKTEPPSEDEFWFDFIADSGDGQMAVYNVAYLCLSDLWCQKKSKEPSTQDERRVSIQPPKKDKDSWEMLPRGAFLFVGGDTSYHVSDYATNSYRFQLPFHWAFVSVRQFYNKIFRVNGELKPDGTIDSSETQISLDAEPARPIFAVPANHDYYDDIDGFNRQFRRPKTPEHLKQDPTPPLLAMLGFERQQEASYIALRLPYGWWLWGIDSELNKIDFRQERFFRELNNKAVPQKLIVATPEPTTFFCRKPKKFENPDNEDKTSRYLRALGLKRPFMDEDLPEGTCRLDISGDVHNYERYWGTDNKSGKEFSNAPGIDNYASIVAGGGGAFLHPTHTIYKSGIEQSGIEAKVLYPKPIDSNNSFAERLFDIYNIWKGGYVWLIGAIMSGIIFFALTLSPATRALFDNYFFKNYFKLSIPPSLENICPCSQEIMYAPMWNPHLWILALLLILSAVFLVLGTIFFGKAVERIKHRSSSAFRPVTERIQFVSFFSKYFSSFYAWQAFPKELILSCVVTFAFSAFVFGAYLFCLYIFWSKIERAHPLAVHFLFLLHLIGMCVFFALSSKYSKLLDKIYRGLTNKEKRFQKFFNLPKWAFNIWAVFSLVSGLILFGRQAGVCVLSDTLLWIISLGALAGLFYFGYGIGSDLQPNLLGKIRLGVLGAWHALLQLLVPVLYVRVGGWFALFILITSVVVTSAFGKYSVGSLAMKTFPNLLVVLWFVYGLAVIILPFYLPHFTAAPVYSAEWSFAGNVALAILLGCVMSMVWLGWYLAVSLSFNGHNNEAGGAGRLEKFRHIVRICLTKNNLNVYVIAFDEANKEGEDLRLRLIDNFTLNVTQAAPTPKPLIEQEREVFQDE